MSTRSGRSYKERGSVQPEKMSEERIEGVDANAARGSEVSRGSVRGREAEATASGRRREAAATASDRRREGSDARANGNAHEAHWKVSASGGDENKCFTRGGRTR